MNDIKNFPTAYLKILLDHVLKSDGVYGHIIVEDGGYAVNGVTIGDIRLEMHRRGESKYILSWCLGD